jgi:hypothetical protein
LELSRIEEQFIKYYDRLILETLHARAHINLWERLEKYKTTGYVDELNQARYFFTFTIKAHLDNVLLTLSRIIDTHKDSLTIWKFLDFAEQNTTIFSTQAFRQRMRGKPGYDENWDRSHKPITLKEIDEDRHKLESMQHILSNINTWRNKVVAHINRPFLLSGKIVAEECPLKIQQLHELTGTLFQILDRYSSAFNSSTYAEAYPGEDDIQFVMDCIRFYIEEQNKQIEAELEALKKNNK